MKGITGHRVHDAYTNMKVTPLGQSRPSAPLKSEVSRADDDAAQVKISEGARMLSESRASDLGRVEALRDKAAQGPAAFDIRLVAERLAIDMGGLPATRTG